MIKFTDFVKIPNAKRTKVKFNMNAGDASVKALDLLLDDDFRWIEMNSWKTKHANNNLNYADYLIALAQYHPYGPEYYMFGGLYRVETLKPEAFNTVGYSLQLMEENQEFIKRLIIKIKKPLGQSIYNRHYETIQHQLEPEVFEVIPETKLFNFPGYERVLLTHQDMERIIRRNEPTWKQALSQVKGVYVVTDISNGKLYIGSASGETAGLWQRWAAYADRRNMTGGNKGFIEVLEKFDRGYIEKNFRYSILEIFDMKTKQERIRERESFWMRALATRGNGYN